MATNSISNSFIYRHDNYNTTSSAATKSTTSAATPSSVNVPISYLLIVNTDAANDASVSLDGGTTFINVPKSTQLELWPSNLYSYKIKDTSSGSHAAIQCLYGSEL